VAVTQQTLDTAQKSYDLTLLQFHTGTGTELAVSQAQTVVEQARANYSAEVRGRAQAENALVLLLGQPLPADLPPAVPLNSQTLLTDIRPACPPTCWRAARTSCKPRRRCSQPTPTSVPHAQRSSRPSA